jgi:bacterioferritin B
MSKLSSATLALLYAQYAHETSNQLRYIARSSWARFRGLEATADFFAREAKGEHGHAKIVRQFIEDRNEALVPEIAYDEPADFSYFDELFTTALVVEQTTTEMLNNIYVCALKEGDIQTVAWVQALIAEQTEEENLYQTIIDHIVQRGGGVAQDEALDAFRKDLSAVHDIDAWIGEQK